MKRFTFPLRAVAVMRTNRELRTQLALAAARQAAAQAAERSADARARAADTARAIAEGRSGHFRPSDQAAFMALHRRECAAASEAEGQAVAARAETDRRLAACIEARRDLRIVNRLEDKARAEHRAACLALEQQQMEELSRPRPARDGGVPGPGSLRDRRHSLT
jgi:flagellar FliJ protein